MKNNIVIAGFLFSLFGFGPVINGPNAFAAEVAVSTDAVGFTDISAIDAVEMMKNDKNIFILDVRSVKEITSKPSRLKGAKLIPEEELVARMGELAEYKNKKMLVVCPCGVRSRRAAAVLAKSGFGQVYNIIPGMPGLEKVPGAPIER